MGLLIQDKNVFVPRFFPGIIFTAESNQLSNPLAARGQLDISKAEFLLGYKPTKLKNAVKKTVDFYERAQQT